MSYINTFNDLVDSWISSGTNINLKNELISSDPFLSTQLPGNGLLTPDYFDAMPEPYWGNIDNNLVIYLDLNPGYTDSSNKKGYPADNVVLSRSQMQPYICGRYSEYALSFPHLDPFPHHRAGADWWQSRMTWLNKVAEMCGFVNSKSNETWECKPFALELCPWHSKKWSDAGISVFSIEQKRWIEDNVFSMAQDAIKGSKLDFMIGIGKPVFDAATQLGFKEIKRWSSKKDIASWPVNASGKDVNKVFSYLKKDNEDGSSIKLLAILKSMYQRTPSSRFDNVLRDIIAFIQSN